MVLLMRCRSLWIFLGSVLSLFLWNEFLVYYFVLLQCNWPQLQTSDADFREFFQFSLEKDPLKAMLIADTHLLGRGGHWFDKLRREWQMQRTFQSAMFLFNPDVVFLLGDLMDDGKWSSDEEFQETVDRFYRMFKTPKSSNLEIVVGNHDIGFHYMVNDHKRERFKAAFKSPSVKLINIRGVSFILLNSMAFEGDKCSMCSEAEEKLTGISHTLSCARGEPEPSACVNEEKFHYTKPIVLQHFPMFRENDADCSGPDSAPPHEKFVKMKPKIDCLSKDATQKILSLIKPRLVIDAHTHNYCERDLSDGISEYTLSSFNWRNKQNPSFVLLTVNSNNYAINKCYIPNEVTVIWTYIICGIIILLWLIIPTRLCSGISKSSRTIKRQ